MLSTLVAVVLCLSPVDVVAIEGTSPRDPGVVRIATFNVSLYGDRSGEVARRLRGGADTRAKQLAAIVQTIRPDVLLVNEIEFDAEDTVPQLLNRQYFAVADGGRDAIDFPNIRGFPSNTGLDSGLDLDGDGTTGEPVDAWGYGTYAGQYALAVFSRYAIDESGIRSFQQYRWSQLPDALRPSDPDSDRTYYSEDTWRRLRLSSKTHVDIPLRIGGRTLHVLASHPTPPVFDGPEDRNGCRNHDEIRFWSDYLKGPTIDYLVDDKGRRGGLATDASFVIAGDLNADPDNGDGRRQAIRALLSDPRTIDPRPRGENAASERPRRGAYSALATADFGRNGWLRVDYVLPSSDLSVVDAGVFWPAGHREQRQWITASDHRLVWVDVRHGDFASSTP